MPLDNIAEVFVIGSITGYKYSETSDIDVNVNVFAGEEKWQRIQDIYNGNLAIGTRRPINFFIEQWYKPRTPETWSDYIYGAYDLVRDKWLKEPPSPEGIRNPKEEFRQELEIGSMVARNFLRETEHLRKDLSAYKDLKEMKYYPGLRQAIARKKVEIEEDIKDLIDQAKDVKENRQWIYRRGFGVPRKSFRNIVFKLIEHGQYGELFEALKSINKEQLEEAKKSLF